MMREETLIPGFTSRFCFVKLTLGMPIFTRRSIPCKYSSKNICTVVDEWHHGYFSLGYFLFFDTLRPRDKDGSEGVAAVCSGFWARSLLSCRKLHWSPFEQWPFSFHWNQVPFPVSTPLIPFRFLTTSMFQFSRAWRQSFAIEVSDLFSLFTIVFKLF